MTQVRTASASARRPVAGAGLRAEPASGSAVAESRQWAIKNVGGGLMIAAAVLVTVVTVLYDLRGEPFPMFTREVNYALSAAVAAFGFYLMRTTRRLPTWLANSLPSGAAIVICLPTSVDESPDELGPLLLTWPVTFAAAVLSARVAWTTAGVAAVVFAVLAGLGRGVDGLVLWVEASASLAVVCWMVVRVQSQAMRLREALARLARTDALTGLVNRRGFDEALAREQARRRRGGEPSALLLVDIDHFKRVNDTWGHQAGDETLRLLGGLLDTSFRATDVVGRIGGEEFAVLLADCDPDEAAERAQALCDLVRTQAGTWEHPITVSVGVAATPEPAPTPEELMASADAALYAAKAAGRDRVWIEPATVPVVE
ncbi:GGDEF domain-containing protein [Actinospica durhamensis]|uniref:GGDEF domain-containing protein n=1 Tax=Actinospica durhamensis TaxID=1508375 RepID=A0A941IPH3_9ACTN|nr:GGDEF domain-containing protein [Actinospica durhamensis]MBR7836535.1 GGDEF domain-containing protein [Actinospica durhamensis]